jgi:hypothetical protein
VVVTVVTTTADGIVKRFRNIRWFASSGGGWQLVLWFNDELP